MAVPGLPDKIKPLFHNYHPEMIDVERDAEWIILTVLLYGEWEQIKWAFRTYGWNRIEEVVKKDIEGMKTLPHSIASFWSIVFWGRALPEPTLREKWAITRIPLRRKAMVAEEVHKSLCGAKTLAELVESAWTKGIDLLEEGSGAVIELHYFDIVDGDTPVQITCYDKPQKLVSADGIHPAFRDGNMKWRCSMVVWREEFAQVFAEAVDAHGRRYYVVG